MKVRVKVLVKVPSKVLVKMFAMALLLLQGIAERPDAVPLVLATCGFVSLVRMLVLALR